MAHPETPEAVVAPASYDEDSAAAAIDNLLNADAQQDDPAPEQSEEEGDPADLDLKGEEEGDDADEPETPAIAPPVSLNADEKAKFSQLPPEAQQLILDVEARRNADVTKVTTRAAEAQRAAEAAAANADVQAKAVYAQQLQAFAQAFEPVPPSAELAYSHPEHYLAEKARYEAEKAQHDSLMQRVFAIGAEANEQGQALDQQARAQALMQIPEFSNPETRDASIERALLTADALGISQDIVAQRGDASDFRALLQAANWKEKADKYDQAMARQMQKVRAGKARTLRPNAAPAEGSGKARAYSEATQRLRGSGSIDDAAAAIAAIQGF